MILQWCQTYVVRTGFERLSEQVVCVGHTSMLVARIPDSAPGVPASAGSGRTPAEAETPAPGPCGSGPGSESHTAPLQSRGKTALDTHSLHHRATIGRDRAWLPACRGTRNAAATHKGSNVPTCNVPTRQRIPCAIIPTTKPAHRGRYSSGLCTVVLTCCLRTATGHPSHLPARRARSQCAAEDTSMLSYLSGPQHPTHLFGCTIWNTTMLLVCTIWCGKSSRRDLSFAPFTPPRMRILGTDASVCLNWNLFTRSIRANPMSGHTWTRSTHILRATI